MTTEQDSMSPDEFRHLVGRLGFATSDRANDEGLSATARFFGRSPRQAMDWARGAAPVPVYVAKMLRLMAAHKLAPADVDKLTAKRRR